MRFQRDKCQNVVINYLFILKYDEYSCKTNNLRFITLHAQACVRIQFNPHHQIALIPSSFFFFSSFSQKQNPLKVPVEYHPSLVENLEASVAMVQESWQAGQQKEVDVALHFYVPPHQIFQFQRNTLYFQCCLSLHADSWVVVIW